LQAIRPCRESKTGWTAATDNGSRRNQSSYDLNEHGPALNVFWSRPERDGRRVGEGVLAKASASDKRTADQEKQSRRELAMASAPSSFRFEMG
jgi:hypothetical protein